MKNFNSDFIDAHQELNRLKNVEKKNKITENRNQWKAPLSNRRGHALTTDHGKWNEALQLQCAHLQCCRQTHKNQCNLTHNTIFHIHACLHFAMFHVFSSLFCLLNGQQQHAHLFTTCQSLCPPEWHAIKQQSGHHDDIGCDDDQASREWKMNAARQHRAQNHVVVRV